MHKQTLLTRIAGGVLALFLLGASASSVSANTLKLFFVRADSGGSNIYSIDPAAVSSSNQPKLIVQGTTPNFSKDGTKMVFVRADGLYLSAPDGSGVTRLTTGVGDASPSFDDAGARVVYISSGKVTTIKVDKTGRTAITSGTADRTPRFNHADHTVYFARADGSNGTNPVLYSTSDTGGAANLTTSANTVALSSMAVVQADDQLICSRNGSVRYGLFRADLISGSSSSPLLGSLPGDQYPALAPDEKKIVFSSTSNATGRAAAGATGDVFIADFDAASYTLSNVADLTNSTTNEFAPVLASVPTAATPTNHAPTIVSLTPRASTNKVGDKATFDLVVNDADGNADIREMWIVANTKLDWSSGATFAYLPATNALYLRANDHFVGPFAPGGLGTLSNGSVSVAASEVTVTRTATRITLRLPLTIASGMMGNNTIWARVQDNENALDPTATAAFGNKRMTTWTVAPSGTVAPANPTVTIAPGTPGAYGTWTSTVVGTEQPFTLTLSDANGADDIESAWFLLNKSLDWAHGFCLVYVKRTGRLYLRSDDGASWLGGAQLGTSGTLGNGAGSVQMDGVKAISNGNTITLSVPFTPATGLLGTQKLYTRVQDNEGHLDPSGQTFGFVVNGTVSVAAISSLGFTPPKPSGAGS